MNQGGYGGSVDSDNGDWWCGYLDKRNGGEYYVDDDCAVILDKNAAAYYYNEHNINYSRHEHRNAAASANNMDPYYRSSSINDTSANANESECFVILGRTWLYMQPIALELMMIIELHWMVMVVLLQRVIQ